MACEIDRNVHTHLALLVCNQDDHLWCAIRMIIQSSFRSETLSIKILSAQLFLKSSKRIICCMTVQAGDTLSWLNWGSIFETVSGQGCLRQQPSEMFGHSGAKFSV